MNKVLNTYNEYSTVLVGKLLVILRHDTNTSYPYYYELDADKAVVNTSVLFSGGIERYTKLAKDGIENYHPWAMLSAVEEYHKIMNSPPPIKEYTFTVTFPVQVIVVDNDDLRAEKMAKEKAKMKLEMIGIHGESSIKLNSYKLKETDNAEVHS